MSETTDDVNNEVSEDKTEEPAMSSNEVEKLEEAKLKAKYPMASTGGLTGHSAFLQKKLTKGTKYFDSGDYQMARMQQKARPANNTPNILMRTGEAIPTPETVPARKTSIIQTKYQQTTITGISNSPPPSSALN